MDKATNKAPKTQTKTNVVEDDEYIEVNSPNNSTPLSDASVPTILHYFDNCDVHFHAFLSENTGLAFEVSPVHRDPTLVINKPGPMFGVSLEEYSATALYLVPKIHASNRMPQVQKSDLELIIEHVKPGKKERVFLCAVISTDNTNAKKVRGRDTGLIAWMSSINTSSKNPTQFRVNNSRLLPVSTTLAFPGINECLSYVDSDGNTVLLLPDPLLVPSKTLTTISAQISGSSGSNSSKSKTHKAPIFGSFDLLPPDSVDHILPTRYKFMSNMISTNPLDNTDAEDADNKDADNKDADNKDANNEATDNADTNTTKEGFSKKKTKKVNKDAEFSLIMLSTLVVGFLIAIPLWLLGPELYKNLLKYFIDSTEYKTNGGIWANRIMSFVFATVAFTLMGLGGSYHNYSMLISGILIIFYNVVFNASVIFETQKSESMFNSIPITDIGKITMTYTAKQSS